MNYRNLVRHVFAIWWFDNISIVLHEMNNGNFNEINNL